MSKAFTEVVFVLPECLPNGQFMLDVHATLRQDILSLASSIKTTETQVFTEIEEVIACEPCIEYAVLVDETTDLEKLMVLIIKSAQELQQRKVYIRNPQGEVRFIDVPLPVERDLEALQE